MSRRWTALASLVLAGFALRGIEAVRKSLWLDEFHTLHVADSGSFVEVVEKIEPDFHPPLFFWGLSFLRDVDPHLQRWVPIVLSMLALVPLLAIVRRAHLSLAGQAVLCGVFALAPYQVQYGAELRSYSALQLIAVVLAWAAFTPCRSVPRRAVAFGVCAVIGLHVHYFTIIALLAVVIVHAFCRRDEWISRRALLLASGAGILSMLPWMVAGEVWLLETPLRLAEAGPTVDDEGVSHVPDSLAWWEHDLAKTRAVAARTLVPILGALGSPAAEIARVGAVALFGVIAVGVLRALAVPIWRRRRPLDSSTRATLSAGLLAFALTLLLCIAVWKRVRLQYFAVAAWVWPLVIALLVDGFVRTRARVAVASIVLLSVAVVGLGHAFGASREDTRRGVEVARRLGAGRDAVYTAVLRQPPFYPHARPLSTYAPEVHALEPDEVTDDDLVVIVLTRKTAPDGPSAWLWSSIRRGRELTQVEVVDDATRVLVYERR